MKTLLVLFIAILAQTLGDVWLTKGMKAVGEVDTLVPGELLAVGWQVFTNPLIWAGIGLLFVFFVLYLTALSWADLSYVLPVTAFGYALNAAMAKYLLGEHVSPARWAGTMVICVGVAVVSRTEQRTTERAAKPEAEAEAGRGAV
jgi:drug/metabolite transporter (DMT)-like permease